MAHFENITALTWQKTAESLLRDHTLFPFYSSSNPSETVARARRAAISGNPLSAVRMLGANYLPNAPKCLRVCKQCRDEEVGHFGEAYWHRSHQLPGVVVCHVHGSFLTQTNVLLSQPPFVAAHEAKLREIAVPRMTACSKRLLLEIATRAHKVLTDPELLTDFKSSCWRLRLWFFRLGYGRSPRCIEAQSSWKAMRTFFGDEVLQLCLGKHVSNPEPLVFAISPLFRKRVPPIFFIMLDMFIEDAQMCGIEVPDFALVDRYKCPLPWRREEHWVEWISWLRTPKGLAARGSCSCGVSFTFRDPTLPIVDCWKPQRKKKLGVSSKKYKPNAKLEREFIKRIRAAAISMKRELPPQRLTGRSICYRAGLPRSLYKKPSCNAVLKENAESREAFLERLIRYAFTRGAAYSPEERKQLLDLCGRRRSPRLNALVVRLIRKQLVAECLKTAA